MGQKSGIPEQEPPMSDGAVTVDGLDRNIHNPLEKEVNLATHWHRSPETLRQ